MTCLALQKKYHIYVSSPDYEKGALDRRSNGDREEGQEQAAGSGMEDAML